MPRPFECHRQRSATAVGRSAGAIGLIMLAVVALLSPFVNVLLLPLLWYLGFAIGEMEFGVLAGNRRLRREVAERLRGFGHLVETGRDRFVGLAYPCFYGHRRRLRETDDDVGFLTVDERGLAFLGDGVEFVVPAEQIAAVRLVRDASTLFLSNRVVIDTLDGEPQDTIVFDSRGCAAHSACNRDNARLAAEIRAVMRPAAAARLAAPVGEPAIEADLLTHGR